jgi:hypothetical protein
LVKEPIIGLNYHISWARKRGMLWKLVKIVGDTAHLKTPKTKRPITCKVSELRETNNRANRNSFNRLFPKLK